MKNIQYKNRKGKITRDKYLSYQERATTSVFRQWYCSIRVFVYIVRNLFKIHSKKSCWDWCALPVCIPQAHCFYCLWGTLKLFIVICSWTARAAPLWKQEKLKTSLLILKNIFLVTWVGTFSFSNCSLWLIWCCWKLFLKIHNLSQSFCLPCSSAVFCVRSEPISDCGSAKFFSPLQPTSAMQAAAEFFEGRVLMGKAYFHSLPSFSLKSPH